MDLTLARHAHIPARLVHRFALSPSNDQRGAETRVGLSGPVQLGPPLRGGGLFAGNGCCSTSGHARQTIPGEDLPFIPQRYAIDFLQLQDGSPFGGDPTKNESYFIFGDEVIAAGPGRMVATRDGMPENTPPDQPVTDFEGAGGNFVLVDMGGDLRLLRPPAHRQRASGRRRPGAARRGARTRRQHRGVVRAPPPLHVADRPSPLFSQGVPYVFRDFQLEARVIGLETGEPSIVPADPPRPPAPAAAERRHHRLPTGLTIRNLAEADGAPWARPSGSVPCQRSTTCGRATCQTPPDGVVWLASKESNLESPDPESGALPFGHSPVTDSMVAHRVVAAPERIGGVGSGAD